MDQKTKQVFEKLVSLQGKKLTWVGFDAEEEGFYLRFEDGTTFLLFGQMIDKFGDVAQAILTEELTQAKQMLALHDIMSLQQEVKIPKADIVKVETESGVVIVDKVQDVTYPIAVPVTGTPSGAPTNEVPY